MNSSLLLNNSGILHNANDSMYLANLQRIEQYNTDKYNQLKLYYDQRIAHLNTTIVNTLQSMSSDNVIATLCNNNISIQFIQQRITELVQQQLTHENELLLKDCLNKLSTKTATVKQCNSEINEWTQKYAVLQQQYNALQQQQAHHNNQQYNDLVNKNALLQQQCQTLTEQYNALTEQYNAVQASNTTLTSELHNVKHTLNHSINDSDDKLSNIITRYESQLAMYKDKLQQSEQSMKQLQAELQNTTLSLSSEKQQNRYNCSSDICKQKLIELMNEKQQLKLDCKAATDRVTELTAKVAKLKANDTRLAAQLDTQLSEKAVLEQKYHAIGEKLNELLKHDESAVNTLIHTEQAKRQRLKTEYAEYKQKCRILLQNQSTTINEQEKKILECEMWCKQYDTQCSKLQQRIDELSSARTTHIETNNTRAADAQVQRLQDTLDKLKNDAFERETKYSAEKQALQYELTHKQQQAEMVQAELKHQCSLLQQQLDSVQSTGSKEMQLKLNDALATQQRQYDDKLRQYDEKVRSEYMLITQHKQLLKECAELEQKQAAEQLARLKQQLTDLHTLETQQLQQTHHASMELLQLQHTAVVNELKHKLEHSDLQPQLEHARRESMSMQSKYDSEHKSYTALQAQYDALQQKYAEAQQHIEALNRQLYELRSSNTDINSQIEVLRRESMMLTDSQQKELQRLLHQQQQLHRSEAAAGELEVECETLRKQLQLVHQSNEQHMAVLQSAINDKNTLIDELKMVTEQKLQDAKLAAEERYELLGKSYDSKLSDVRHECETQIRTVTEQYDRYRAETEQKLNSLQSEQSSSATEMRIKHAAELADISDAHEHNINELKQQHTELTNKQTQQITQLNSTVTDLQHELTSVNDTLQRIKHRYQMHYTAAKNKFILQINTMQQLLLEVKHDSERTLSETAKYASDAVQQVKQQCDHTLQVQLLQQKLKLTEQHQADVDALVAQHSAETASAQAQHDQYSADLHSKHATEIEQLNAQCTELQTSVTALQQQLSDKQHAIDTLNNDAKHLNEQITTLHQAAEQHQAKHHTLIDQHKQQTAELSATIATQQTALTQLIAYLASHVDIAVQVQNDAQAGVSSALHIVHEQLDAYIESLRNTANDLTVEIAALKHSIESAQQQYQLLHQQTAYAVDSLENEIDQLQSELDTQKQAQLLELELCKVAAIEPYKKLIDQQNMSIKALQLEYSHTIKTMESMQLSKSKVLNGTDLPNMENGDTTLHGKTHNPLLLSELDINATINQSKVG